MTIEKTISAAPTTGATPARRDFRFLETMRVRWAEVDLQKIVFNGHYLMYFDTAVAGYWRALALPYHDAMHTLDGDLYVRKASVEYRASARYDDVLHVGVRTQRIGRSSMVLVCAVFRRDQVLVHGELVYVFADPATQTSRSVPDVLREVLQRFERGDATVTPSIGDWASLGTSVRAVRSALDDDDRASLAATMGTHDDVGAVHVALLNGMAMPVASARVIGLREGQAQLDAMAILPALRHGGLLGELLRACASAASQGGARCLHADVPAGLTAALQAHGYAAISPRDDAIVRMQLPLQP